MATQFKKIEAIILVITTIVVTPFFLSMQWQLQKTYPWDVKPVDYVMIPMAIAYCALATMATIDSFRAFSKKAAWVTEESISLFLVIECFFGGITSILAFLMSNLHPGAFSFILFGCYIMGLIVALIDEL